MPEDYIEEKYETVIIETPSNAPMLRIVDFLLDHLSFRFTKREIMEALGMDKQTFRECFSEMEKLRMVKVSGRRKNKPLLSLSRLMFSLTIVINVLCLDLWLKHF